MLLGFKKQFAPYVKDGTKTHTIRGLRADGKTAKIGETLHCYVNPRQKSMKLLGRWPCARVDEIRMYRASMQLNGVELDLSEKNLLAWRDGFRWDGTFMQICDPPVAREAGCYDLMLQFWAKTHGDRVFEGQMIHWDFARPVKEFRDGR